MALYFVKGVTYWYGDSFGTNTGTGQIYGSLDQLTEGSPYNYSQSVAAVSHYENNGYYDVSFTSLPQFLGFYSAAGAGGTRYSDIPDEMCKVVVTTLDPGSSSYVKVTFQYGPGIAYPLGFNTTLLSVKRGSSDKIPGAVITSSGFDGFDGTQNQAFNYTPRNHPDPIYTAWTWSVIEASTNEVVTVVASQRIILTDYKGWSNGLDIKALGYV